MFESNFAYIIGWIFGIFYFVFIIILIALNYIHKHYTQQLTIQEYNQVNDNRYYNYIPTACILCKRHLGYEYNPFLEDVLFVCPKCEYGDYNH